MRKQKPRPAIYVRSEDEMTERLILHTTNPLCGGRGGSDGGEGAI